MIDESSIAQFATICQVLEDEEQYSPREAIGTYKEKQMHVALKRYATHDESRFEVKIGPYIADVCEKDRITEIQTGSFYPLRDKIAYYLNETEYHVTILHPVVTKRTRVWLDPATGEVLSHYRSPRAERVQDALRELFWLAPHLTHPRLTVCLMLVEGDYYYARTSGEILRNTTYWITKTNDLLPAANYTFGADGKMVNPPAVK